MSGRWSVSIRLGYQVSPAVTGVTAIPDISLTLDFFGTSDSMPPANQYRYLSDSSIVVEFVKTPGTGSVTVDYIPQGSGVFQG